MRLQPVSRRPAGVPISAAAAVALVLLAAPSALSAPGPALSGDLTYLDLRASGQMVTSGALQVLQLLPPGANVGKQWSLDVSKGTANWTTASSTGAGQLSISNKPETGERSVDGSEVEFHVVDPKASILIVVEGGAPFEIHTSDSVAVRPSKGEAWKAGIAAATTDPDAPGEHRNVEANHEVPAGTPVALADAAELIDGSGRFVVYLWGVNVNVTTPAGTSTYRSGSWKDGAGAATNAVGTTYFQLLRLSVEGALSIPGWTGTLRAAGPDVAVSGDGKIVFGRASGTLTSTEYELAATEESFAIGGSLHVTSKASAKPERLTGKVVASSDAPDLPPQAKHRVPSGAAPDPLVQAQPAEVPKAPAERSWLPAAFLTLGAIAIAGLVAIIALRRRSRAENGAPTLPPIEAAEAALIRGDGAEARRLAGQLISADPRNVDAWFVHGASLLHEARYAEAVADLEPIAKKSKENGSGLAFLLCLAHLRNGKAARAKPWGLVAAREPDFLRQMEMDETFAPLLDAVPQKVRQPARSTSPDLAYA